MTAPKRTKPALVLSGAFLAALFGALHGIEGNPTNAAGKHPSYWDKAASVWTICEGVTGPDIVAGLEWTTAQCIERQNALAQKFNARVIGCIDGVELALYEHFAILIFSWNVGPHAFCTSSVAENLRKRNYERACARMEEAFFRAGGKDCRIRSNQCYGLIVHRKFSRAMCEGKLAIPGVLQ